MRLSYKAFRALEIPYTGLLSVAESSVRDGDNYIVSKSIVFIHEGYTRLFLNLRVCVI